MSAPVPSVNINIFLLKINSFENASAVNIGQNLLVESHSSDKKNQGYRQSARDQIDFEATRSYVDTRGQSDPPA